MSTGNWARGQVPIAGIVVFAAAVLSTCGPSAPDRVRTQPPAPAQTGAPLPLDHVDRPVDLAKFDADPRGLLTREQVAAGVADPPNNVRANRRDALPAFGCSWTNQGGALMSALRPAQEPKTLAELTFDIQGEDLPGSYWDQDRCGGVGKMAELVIGNLRHG
jgi:hypothetical protein